MNLYSQQSLNTRGLSLWPGMIFVLIGINVCIVMLTVVLAHSDRSLAIEPDYYQQAVEWNQTAAQQRINAALGWKVNVSIAPDRTGPFVIEAIIRDHQGAPIEQALVSAIAFSSLRSADRIAITLKEGLAGVYGAPLPSAHPIMGTWEVRCTIRRGDTVFTCNAHATIKDSMRGSP
jgi:nitrogen fixation protein FixH